MNRRDRQLGIDAEISRRDFLNGVSVAIGATLLPSSSPAQDAGAQDVAGYYPPQLSGMRGSHPGSFEAAHMARDGATWDGEETGEQYDLVVVGGGISEIKVRREEYLSPLKQGGLPGLTRKLSETAERLLTGKEKAGAQGAGG